MEDKIRIGWSGYSQFVKSVPLLDTYLGLKKIGKIHIYNPETGEEILQSYVIGFQPGNQDFNINITTTDLISYSDKDVIMPGPLKKARAIEPNLKNGVAFWVSNKERWSPTVKSVDLYIPISNEISYKEEYRKRTEFDHETFDSVVYTIRVNNEPVVAIKTTDNNRLSPMNRFNDGLRHLSDKYDRLGIRLWPSNVDDYLELSEEIKALKAKLPEYEKEGDIPYAFQTRSRNSD